jgi:DNA-binding MarR family transcriptional regulator
MQAENPKRFITHPLLLMITILKQERRRTARAGSAKQHRLQMPFYTVGAVLAEFGPLSQKEVSDRIAMDSSDVVSLIDAMEHEQFVKRLRDMHDRRRYRLELTAQGRDFMQSMDQIVRRKTADFLAPLTPDERQQLMALLQKLLR